MMGHFVEVIGSTHHKMRANVGGSVHALQARASGVLC
jgi:hypothetical protein